MLLFPQAATHYHYMMKVFLMVIMTTYQVSLSDHSSVSVEVQGSDRYGILECLCPFL